MSFTHDTLINALRDVIREEIKTLAVEILRDESSDFAIELGRQIESLIESNGTITSFEDQSLQLIELNDSLADLKQEVINLEDEMPDTSNIDDRLNDLEGYVSENDVDDIASRLSVIEERADKLKRSLMDINDATDGLSYV